MDQQLDGEAFHLLWQTLRRRVHRQFYWLDWTESEDAIEDAVLHWYTRHGGEAAGAWQGAEKLPLSSLYREACRNMDHSIRTDRRRRHREQEYARQKKNWPHEDFFVPNELWAGHIPTEEQKDELARLLEGCSAWEQAFVALRRQGIREVTAYAEVLGVSQCPQEEQRRAVNRAWNRLRKKLQRAHTHIRRVKRE